jgi:hypothetical protein
MAVDPPTSITPSGVPSRTVDSGDHPAIDRNLTMRFGKKARITLPLEGTAKFFVIPILTALVPLIISLRAPTKGDVQAKVEQVEKTVETTAKTKAEEVRKATAKPIDNHAAELTTLRDEVAKLAAIVDLYSKLPPAPPAPVVGQSPGRRRRELAKKVKAAVIDLKAIQVRAATEPDPLKAPKAAPPEPPKQAQAQQPPQQQAPVRQQGAGGGNP